MLEILKKLIVPFSIIILISILFNLKVDIELQDKSRETKTKTVDTVSPVKADTVFHPLENEIVQEYPLEEEKVEVIQPPKRSEPAVKPIVIQNKENIPNSILIKAYQVKNITGIKVSVLLALYKYLGPDKDFQDWVVTNSKDKLSSCQIDCYTIDQCLVCLTDDLQLQISLRSIIEKNNLISYDK